MTNQEKFLLCTLKLRAWSGRKFDRTETEDVGERRKTNAARVNKQLPSDEWLAPLVSHDSLIRREFYRLTLATDVTSIRLLPEQARKKFEARMFDLLETRADVIASMMDSYEQEVVTAPERLGELFDEDDFPDLMDLLTKYGASVGYLPAPASWKMGVGNGTVAKAADDTRAEMLATAHNDAWDRITDHLETLVDKLAAYKPAENGERAKGVFRDSLVENIATMIDTLKTLNVFGDKVLDAAIADIESQIANVSPDMLREDAYKRTVISELARIIVANRLISECPEDSPEQVEQEVVPVEGTALDKLLDQAKNVAPDNFKAGEEEDYMDL